LILGIDGRNETITALWFFSLELSGSCSYYINLKNNQYAQYFMYFTGEIVKD
jgi:hypothetical protein